MWKIVKQILNVRNQGIKKILKRNSYIRTVDNIKIQEKSRIKYQKGRYQKNPEKQLKTKKEVPRKSYIIIIRI